MYDSHLLFFTFQWWHPLNQLLDLCHRLIPPQIVDREVCIISFLPVVSFFIGRSRTHHDVMWSFRENSGKMLDWSLSSVTELCSWARYINPGIKNSEYDQEIPQSQTAYKPMALRGRATQPSRDTRKTNYAKQPALSSPIKLIAKLEWT